MIKLKKLFIYTITACFLLSTFIILNNRSLPRVSASSQSSEIVMELHSGRVLKEYNAHEKKYMASTTKILTAITIIENCKLDDVITVSKETTGIEGSSIYLEEGERLTVKELLYGLMLRSGNDCAETLALYCSKSIVAFAKLMNETAKQIGAKNSNFVNPHGLHNDEHYTTAYDLALISSYAMKNQSFREIVGTSSVNISFSTRNYKRHLTNKNKMLKEFEGSTGIKTGYTKKAGRCLVSSCKRNGMELICVVLNCPPMFERSKNLLTECFNEYENYALVNKSNIVGFINVENFNKKCAVSINNDIILPLTEGEKNNIKIIYELPQSISAPVKKGEEIGFIKIFCENNLLFLEKIYTIVEIK